MLLFYSFFGAVSIESPLLQRKKDYDRMCITAGGKGKTFELG